MAAFRTVRFELLRVLLLTLLMLFLIPGSTLVFTHHVQRAQDADFVRFAQAQVAADTRLSPAQKRQAADAYSDYSVTAVCASDAPKDEENREMACSRYSMLWQFHWAARVAVWTLVLGGLMLTSSLMLGALAFANRKLLYGSFVAGWRLLTGSSAVQVVLQSALVVWLSFWLTAYFWERYSIKLIGLAGILAVAAVFFAVYTLLKRMPSADEIEGEAVTETDAPRLWSHVRQLASRMRTVPPDAIVAGIDANFFVTEAPCRLKDRTLKGRTLFVSLPLLRVLDRSEADAVLAHELAHLAGGDTRTSASLGPKLLQFDRYTWQLRQGGLTIVAHYLLRLYRMIFEYALARDSREREHLADRLAVQETTPGAMVRALIKISAYASYRRRVEERLFAAERRHGPALGIASFVADGLSPYARSDEFARSMETADVPHPYDSHPPLIERMHNVGHRVAVQDYGDVVATVAQSSWAEDIDTAPEIERRLWADYERQFVQEHDANLAYRYEPANEEEAAVVLRHFPALDFALKAGASIGVTYAGLCTRAETNRLVGWDEVKGMRYKDSVFGDSLTVTHPEKRWLRARTTKIKLAGLGKRKDEFKSAVSAYWNRHLVMRAIQSEQNSPT